MDIFAHGLWGAVAAKAANLALRKKNVKTGKVHEPLRIEQAAWWSIFPDIAAFLPLFVFFGIGALLGELDLSAMPRPSEVEMLAVGNEGIFGFTRLIYSLSHSIFVFGAVFLLVTVFRRSRRVKIRTYRGLPYEMLGWMFHVLIDVPTHSYTFYPTPFLFPFSKYMFDGLPWGTPWFLVLNYAALLGLFAYLRRKDPEPVFRFLRRR